MAVIYKQTVENLSERRIDAWHYQPNFQNQINKIKQNVGVIFLNDVIDKSRGVASGATPLGANYLQNGKVKFYRTSEVEGMFLDSQKAVYISEDDDEKLARSRLKAGDILLTITGAKFGKSAVVSELHLPGNISQHSVRFHPKPELIDSYFLVAYLESDIGQDVIWREAYGATRPAIDFPSVRALTLPKVNLIAQKYIGDKVRQAELLREWAKSLRKQIKSYFDNLFEGLDLSSPVQRYGRVSLDNLVPRLNAEYYAEQYLQVEKYLKNKFGVLATIGELSPTVRSKVRPETNCIYKEIGDLDTATGKFGQGTHYTYFDVPNNAQRVFDAGDVAISTRRPNRGAIAVVEESSQDIFYSVFLARLKPKNKSFGYWLKEYLRYDAGKLLLLQRCTWTTYPVISEDDLETVPVPELVDDWEHIAKLSTQSVLLEEYATKLTHVAKEIVEGLIEGMITEDHLIQAHNFLEQGVTSLDRAILSQMTEDGYAVAGSKPLFSDLDEFYDLLEQAKTLE